MFPDCVNQNGIHTSLFLEQITDCYLWKAKDICKVGCLLSCKLCDVSLGDLLECLSLNDLLHLFHLRQMLLLLKTLIDCTLFLLP